MLSHIYIYYSLFPFQTSLILYWLKTSITYISFVTKLTDNFLHTVITIITADGIIIMSLPFDQNDADLTNIRIILRRIKHNTK